MKYSLQTSLSFDQAPPISVPLRFFLTAPLFGMAAGLILAFNTGEPLNSRWHSVTLALTHLLVAGFLLQAMAGALFQFSPVVTGANVRRPILAAWLIHPTLALGTPALAWAFIAGTPALFVLAALLLGLGLGCLVIVIGAALLRAKSLGNTLPALKGALLALLLTTLLGITLALTLGNRITTNLIPLLEAHQAWGLAGWALLLLAGISWAVVPMFQITPSYPRVLTQYFTPVSLCALVLLSAGLLLNMPLLVDSGKSLLLLVAAAFAISTLRIQARRKRKTTDNTLIFFRVSMISLLFFCAAGILLLMLPGYAGITGIAVAMGILLILGVFGSAVCGMLYKIVPFIIWLHLQKAITANNAPPSINRMIVPAHCRKQMFAHLIALALLLPSPWLPELARAGGICLTLSCAGLLWNLWTAVRILRVFKLQTPVNAGHPQS